MNQVAAMSEPSAISVAEQVFEAELFDHPTAPTTHRVDMRELPRVIEVHAARRDDRVHEAEQRSNSVVLPEASGVAFRDPGGNVAIEQRTPVGRCHIGEQALRDEVGEVKCASAQPGQLEVKEDDAAIGVEEDVVSPIVAVVGAVDSAANTYPPDLLIC